MEKKSNVTFVFAIILISILGFFVVFNYFISTNNSVASSTQNLACRNLVTLKNSNFGKLIDFFSNLNYKCGIDKITVSSNKKQDVFKKIADESLNCWNRYGAGGTNFLGSYSAQGNWCFKCGSIDFNSKNQVFSYSDYISYLQNNNPVSTLSQSKGNYYQSFNVKSADITSSQISDITLKLNDVFKNGDLNQKHLALPLSQELLYAESLSSKKIDTSQPLYIVYRFNERSSNIEQNLQKSTSLLSYGVLVNGIYNDLRSSGISWSSGMSCSGGLFTYNCISTTTKIVANSIKNLLSSASSTSKLNEILDISNELNNAIQVSLKPKGFSTINNVEILSGDIKGLQELSSLLKSSNNVDIANKVDDIIINMNNLKVNSFTDINPSTKSINIEITPDKTYVQNIIKDVKDSNILSNSNVIKATQLFSTYKQLTNDFQALQTKVTASNFDFKDTKDLNDYFDAYLQLTAAAAGKVVSTNTNSSQYISVMSPEEYYQECGTQRFTN